MTEKNFVTKIQIYSYTELNDDDKKLVDMAREATHSSYAPYSHFHVGAALLLENGVMIKGANQENAAFAGTCGERSACYNAGANYTTNAAATMYAQWTANTYKVKFNGNGSTSGSSCGGCGSGGSSSF